MDGTRLWGKGGCVVRISQGMPLGADILPQMSSGTSCCLRFKICIKGCTYIYNRGLSYLLVQTDPHALFRALGGCYVLAW